MTAGFFLVLPHIVAKPACNENLAKSGNVRQQNWEKTWKNQANDTFFSITSSPVSFPRKQLDRWERSTDPRRRQWRWTMAIRGGEAVRSPPSLRWRGHGIGSCEEAAANAGLLV